MRLPSLLAGPKSLKSGMTRGTLRECLFGVVDLAVQACHLPSETDGIRVPHLLLLLVLPSSDKSKRASNKNKFVMLFFRVLICFCCWHFICFCWFFICFCWFFICFCWFLTCFCCWLNLLLWLATLGHRTFGQNKQLWIKNVRCGICACV